MLAQRIDNLSMNELTLTSEVLVLGLGKSGLASCRHLRARGVDFAVLDTRTEPPLLESFQQEFPSVTVLTGSWDEELLMNARQIIIAPGIDRKLPALAHAIDSGVEVIGDIELFCREVSAPILAVTGSNGKSTVVTLLAQMIEDAGFTVGLGGNIGTPALELLASEPRDYYVLELSSFQLESTVSLNAAAGVVLNVTEDHMDRYDDMQAYADSKAAIYRGTGCQIINCDDVRVNNMRIQARALQTFSGQSSEADWYIARDNDDVYLMHRAERLMNIDALKIKGHHNHLNALACLALGHSIALPFRSMIRTLSEFRGLPHRCEWVSHFGGIEWINDSKGTNVGASCAAIESLASDNNIILIAGGDGKGSDFSPLRESAQGRVKALVTIGRDGPAIASVLGGLVEHHTALDMLSAVQIANQIARAGDLVLLSPACASLDMFRNYEERGQQFIDAVKSLEIST